MCGRYVSPDDVFSNGRAVRTSLSSPGDGESEARLRLASRSLRPRALAPLRLPAANFGSIVKVTLVLVEGSSMCGRYVSPDDAAIEREFNLVRAEW
jgi:hypothetical protein